MNSCDTLSIDKGYFSSNQNFFGKNSDRPLGEAQPLVFYDAAEHAPGDMVKCTHLTIPQVKHTYATMGCQPYWIWGYEIGVNECGLAIGNEAEGSRCEEETEEGLLGMDMLRLALERAATARQGIDIIASLLKEYGQNANASMLFDKRYENSFMLVDPKEIWLLETAGRHWAAKRVTDWAAISNSYTIGQSFDLCSDGLEQYARNHRFIGVNEVFDFTRAYIAPAPLQREAFVRWNRLRQLMGQAAKPMCAEDVKNIFRDHYEGELTAPRFGGCYGSCISICMHAMTWDDCQTAASLLCTYNEQLGIVCRYAPSVPCCSVYLPVYWTGELPEMISIGTGSFDARSLWWATERLAMAVSVDEQRFGVKVRSELLRLDHRFESLASAAEQDACAMMEQGRALDSKALLQQLMAQCAEEMFNTVTQLADEICRTVNSEGGSYGMRKEFLEQYSARVSMPLFI